MVQSPKERHRRYEDRKTVVRTLGRELEPQEKLHHHIGRVLILCRNQAQHALIHREMSALEACGHKSWRKCQYCGKHDDPSNLIIREHSPGHSSERVYHRECQNKYYRIYRRKNG